MVGVVRLTGYLVTLGDKTVSDRIDALLGNEFSRSVKLCADVDFVSQRTSTVISFPLRDVSSQGENRLMESIAAAMGVVPEEVSKQIEVPSQTSQSGALKEVTNQDIAKLAHALWEERGRPLESAIEDWSRAEEFLNRHMTRTASVGG